MSCEPYRVILGRVHTKKNIFDLICIKSLIVQLRLVYSVSQVYPSNQTILSLLKGSVWRGCYETVISVGDNGHEQDD